MRLMFVGNDAGYFVSHRLALARHAQALGHEVIAVLPEAGLDAYRERLQVDRIEAVGYPFARSSMNPLRDGATLLALLKLYRRLRPDIVHHLTTKPVLYGGVAARLAGVPRVILALPGLGHLFFDHAPNTRLARRLLAPLFRYSLGGKRARVIFQNPDDRQSLIASGFLPAKAAGRCVVIPGSGVDPGEYPASPLPDDEAPIVLVACRMVRQKGIPTFVDAARLLRRQGSRARFVLCGDNDPGNPNSIAESLLHSWVAEGTVEWWGRRDKMPAIFAQSTIVVSSSEFGEGVPKALIEAASCGRPIIATDVPGCREIVRHGENGELVPAGDAAAMAAAIGRVLADSALAARYGAHSRTLVENVFALQHVLRNTAALYEIAT